MSRRNIDLPVAGIAVRYRAGESIRVLGRAYGVANKTIWNRLHAAGVEMRPRGGPRGNKNGMHRSGGPLHDSGGGYLGTYDREGKQSRFHRGCWEAYNGPIPEGHVIHHINGEILDNGIENLACVPHEEHARMHGIR